MNRHGRLMAKISAALALIVLAEILIDDGNGAVVGGFAFAWITALLLTRRAIWKDGSARLALISGAGLAVVLVDDPSLLGWFCSGRLSRLPHSCCGTGSTMRSPGRAGSAGTRCPWPLRR